MAVEERPADYTFRYFVLACLATIFLAFQIYSPALHGQFVFDDLFLPYTYPHAASLTVAQWCGVRPLLGLSFWANFQVSGLNTFTYHAVNVLLHGMSTILLFFIVLKLLKLVGTKSKTGELLAGFAAALFLLHPLQTESVAYIASRSENLSAFFVFCAFCLFLYRKTTEVSWLRAAAVLVLFACGMGTKEHVIAFPAVLLLTDYYFNPGFRFSGIRGNWRLYVPMFFVGLAGVLFMLRYVSRDSMIGFHIQGLTWYQYFFTECRAVFGYIWYFLFPVGLNVDHEFATSLNIMDHGTFLAAGALAALLAMAVLFRKRFPLACYGFLVFLLFLAPTSSFVPIRDVFVERRMYLPIFGLLLVVMEGLRRVILPPKMLAVMLACLCLIPAYLTWRRAAVWTSSTRLWEDSVATAPGKPRPHVGLGNAYMHENRCREASREYEAAFQLGSPDFTLNYNRAAALECMKQPLKAMEVLQVAIAQKPNAAANHALMGMVEAEAGKWQEGLSSLDKAQQLDANYALTYAYRGAVLTSLRQPELAEKEFEKCLRLDPNNAIARRGWNALHPEGS